MPIENRFNTISPEMLQKQVEEDSQYYGIEAEQLPAYYYALERNDRETLERMRVEGWFKQEMGSELSPHFWEDTTSQERARCLFSHGWLEGRRYNFNNYFTGRWVMPIAEAIDSLIKQEPIYKQFQYLQKIAEGHPEEIIQELISESGRSQFFKSIQDKCHLPDIPLQKFWDYNPTIEPLYCDSFSDLFEDKKILDIGGGSNSHQPVHTVADMSLKGMKNNRNATYQVQIENINEACKNNCYLPFRSHSFEVVTVQRLVKYLYDTQAFYRECKRVLIPEGMLFMAEVRVATTHPAKLLEVRRFDSKEMIKELSSVGFEIIHATADQQDSIVAVLAKAGCQEST